MRDEAHAKRGREEDGGPLVVAQHVSSKLIERDFTGDGAAHLADIVAVMEIGDLVGDDCREVGRLSQRQECERARSPDARLTEPTTSLSEAGCGSAHTDDEFRGSEDALDNVDGGGREVDRHGDVCVVAVGGRKVGAVTELVLKGCYCCSRLKWETRVGELFV